MTCRAQKYELPFLLLSLGPERLYIFTGSTLSLWWYRPTLYWIRCIPWPRDILNWSRKETTLVVLQSRQVLVLFYVTPMATRWPTVCLQWPTVRWFSLLDFLLKGLPVDTQDKVIQTYIVAIFSYIRIIFFEPYSFFTYNYSFSCTHRVFYFLHSSGTCITQCSCMQWVHWADITSFNCCTMYDWYSGLHWRELEIQILGR